MIQTPFTGHDVETIIRASEHHSRDRAYWVAQEQEITDGAYFAAFAFATHRGLIVTVGQLTTATRAGHRWLRNPR